MARPARKSRITPPKRKLTTFAEFKEHFQAYAKPVTFWLDNLAEEELAEAEREAREARNRADRLALTENSGAAAAEERALDYEHAAEKLAKEYENMRFEFLFVSIGSKAKSELINAHPPTEEQVDKMREELKAAGEDARGRLQWNSDTYPVALMAASCVGAGTSEPLMTEADADEAWNGNIFNENQRALLVAAALAANP